MRDTVLRTWVSWPLRDRCIYSSLCCRYSICLAWLKSRKLLPSDAGCASLSVYRWAALCVLKWWWRDNDDYKNIICGVLSLMKTRPLGTFQPILNTFPDCWNIRVGPGQALITTGWTRLCQDHKKKSSYGPCVAGMPYFTDKLSLMH